MDVTFIACLNLLTDACNKKVVKRDPRDFNRVMLYRNGEYEGWWSVNIYEVAQQLMESLRNGDLSFIEACKNKGYEVVFTEDNMSAGLKKLPYAFTDTINTVKWYVQDDNQKEMNDSV